MSDRNLLYSKGFPTNRIPVKLPSTGQTIVLRETTVTELKSIAKTIIDNIDRKQMDIIYDAVTEYLQAMVLRGDVDVTKLTEFDRLFCMMVFFQLSFFKEPIQFKCPHCGVDIVYRYDMAKYLKKMESAFVEDQVVEIPYKSKTYEFTLGWPSVDIMSLLYHDFYGGDAEVTEEMERTQLGINYVLSFIKKVVVKNPYNTHQPIDVELDLTTIDNFKDRIDCLNELPSMVMFDENEGVFSKVTGFFVNRLENCFGSETCPQCHKDTYYGLPQSSMFYSLFYGSLKSLYGFIIQVECMMVFRYDCCIFDKEDYMTYNDLQSLIRQIHSTAEKDNKERQKVGHDHLYKGLWLIREILNNMVFPQDKKH